MIAARENAPQDGPSGGKRPAVRRDAAQGGGSRPYRAARERAWSRSAARREAGARASMSGASRQSAQWACSVSWKVTSRRNQPSATGGWPRSEEHTSELQSRENLVCRLPLEKKN